MTDRPLQRIQYGVEVDATPGTLVDATRILGGGTVDFETIDEVYRPNHPVGLYTFNPTTPVQLMRGVDLSFDGDMAVEELIDFLQMSVQEVAPSGMGPYVWLFQPSETGANDPRSYTFERRLTDGTTDRDIELGFVMARSFTITQNLNEQTRLTVDMFGRRIQDGTPNTAALTAETLTFMSSENWKLYIDPESTAHGTNQIAGQVRSFEFTYQSGLFPKYFLDGRTDLDFVSVGTAQRGIESLRIQVEWGAQAELERIEAAAQSLRLIRLEGIRGTDKVIFDFVMRHAKGDFLSVSDADGNDVVDMELVAAHDPSPVATHPAHFECEITSVLRQTL